jgi:hypothetical protein
VVWALATFTAATITPAAITARPVVDLVSGLLELDKPVGLLLHHRGPRSNPTATDEISDPNFDDVAASQLFSVTKAD